MTDSDKRELVPLRLNHSPSLMFPLLPHLKRRKCRNQSPLNKRMMISCSE
jgi:hypothetical protein